MAPSYGEPPDKPEAAPKAANESVSQVRAPKKAAGPATPSRLRQVVLGDTISSPSQVTTTDFTFVSPLKGKAEMALQHQWNKASPNGRYCRRVRYCSGCNTPKAGTELYSHAREFSAFFARCLDDWMHAKESAPRTPSATEAAKPTKMTFAQVIPADNNQPLAKGNHMAKKSQASAPSQAGQSLEKQRDGLQVFIRMDNGHLEPFGAKATLTRRLRLDHQEASDVTRCPSRLALHPRENPTQTKLLAPQDEIRDILNAREVEAHAVWYHYKHVRRSQEGSSANRLGDSSARRDFLKREPDPGPSATRGNSSNTMVRTKTPHVHSVNVAGGQRSPGPTELAINLADQKREQADITPNAGPGVGIPPDRRMGVKTHPNYSIYSPVDTLDSDDTRPRSLIYVRKNLQADQLRPFATRDMTWVKVRGITFASIHTPGDDAREIDEILEMWAVPFGCVTAGDFNAGDTYWDSDNPDYHGGSTLARTMADRGLDLISEPDIPTHDYGNVLGLAFSDVPMAEGSFSRDLDYAPKPEQWIVPEDKLAELAESVHARLHELPTLGFTPNEVDAFAQRLIDIIQGSIKIVGKEPRDFKSVAWWNGDCRTAAKIYRGAASHNTCQGVKNTARREF
ncbi:hypothetical protein DL767_002555 [Monosporascus sp. MG133]|nr:hypothetical protein DL767_002555 [Monosporascus sp. MG133]